MKKRGLFFFALLFSMSCSMASAVPAAVQATLAYDGPYTFVYRELTGDYSSHGAVYAELTEALRRHGISPTRSIGIFFDDPKTVRPEALRSVCGVIIDEKDWGRIEALDGWLKVQHISRARRIVAEYPITGPQSYAEGGASCYPALVEYARTKGYTPLSSFEIYDSAAGKIFYVGSVKELETQYPPVGGGAHARSATTEWPDPEWKVSTPEAQGMDSRQLARMLNTLGAYYDLHDIDSLLISRHGRIVTEVSFAPNEPGRRHVLHSVTKSVLGTLIGVALQKGIIHGLEDRIIDYYPEDTAARRDPRKSSMTVGDLLSMSSGLDFQEYPLNSTQNTHFKLMNSPDWARFAMSLPMTAQPGTRFNYNDGDVSILSGLITKAAGMNAMQFGSRTLFGPLGITDARWGQDRHGNTMGNDGLLLTPRDMAKIGYLYLRDGIWKGERILPEGWVQDITSKPVQTGGALPLYGKLWWVDPSRSFYSADGSGGQLIIVLPEEDIVAVVTASHAMSLQSPSFIEVVHELILPAVKSEKQLPENRQAQRDLAERIGKFASPSRVLPSPPPATASRVSGRRIALDVNPLGIRAARLVFGPDAATLDLFMGKSTLSLPIGLDGIYRKGKPTEKGIHASRGRWEGERTFVIQSRVIEGEFSEEVSLVFDNDRVKIVYTVSDAFWRSFSFEGRLIPAAP
jgi:CubicO group peptidase (beta-lactamase class C family)